MLDDEDEEEERDDDDGDDDDDDDEDDDDDDDDDNHDYPHLNPMGPYNVTIHQAVGGRPAHPTPNVL